MTTLLALVACEPADEADAFSNPGSDEIAQINFEARGLGGIAAYGSDDESSVTSFEVSIDRVDVGRSVDGVYEWESVYEEPTDRWVIDPVAGTGDDLRVSVSHGTFDALLVRIDTAVFTRDGCSEVELGGDEEDAWATMVLVPRELALNRGQILDGYGTVLEEPKVAPDTFNEEATTGVFGVMAESIEVAEGSITGVELGFASSLELLDATDCDIAPEPLWVLGDPGTDWGLCLHDDDITASAFWGAGFHETKELMSVCETELEGTWTGGDDLPGGLPSGALTAEGFCHSTWSSGASSTSFYLGEWGGDEAKEACESGFLDVVNGTEWFPM